MIISEIFIFQQSKKNYFHLPCYRLPLPWPLALPFAFFPLPLAKGNLFNLAAELPAATAFLAAPRASAHGTPRAQARAAES